MTALPSLAICGIQDEQGLSVWRFLLQAEKTALEDTSRNQAKYTDPLIAIRLLGLLVKDFWEHARDGYLGSAPYHRVVLKIRSCLANLEDKAVHKALVELGIMYRNHLFRVCELHKDPTQDLGNAAQTKPNVKKQVCFLGIYGMLDINSFSSGVAT
jgi:hypothetical protein